MLSRFEALVWVLPLLASFACGGRAARATAEKDSSGGNGSGGRATDCASYADQARHTLEVHITNSTGRALYFGPARPGAALTPPFEVRDAADTYLALPDVEPCPDRCANVMSGTGECGYPIPIESARRLLSKGTMRSSWSSTYLLQVALPVVCQPDGSSASVLCAHEVAAPPGVYTFTAQAGTSIGCREGECPACADDDDECLIPGAIIGNATWARATVNLDASYGLSSADRGPPTSLPAVELTFE